MSSVVISGDTSGAITLAAPSVAGTNTATLPAATGTVMVSGNQPAFATYANSSQTVATSTYTVLQGNVKQFDTATAYNNTGSTVTLNGLSVPAYAFCPNVAGYFQITTTYALYSASTGNMMAVLYKNGSLLALGNRTVFTLTASEQIAGMSYLVYLNGTGDYIQSYMWQNSGSSLNSDAGSAILGYFQGVMVRAA